MTKSLSALLVFGLTLLISLPALAQQVSSKAPPLSPEDSIKTMVVQDGYKVIPVLTEPQIHEPSAIAWDGNGRLYVVEMRTYMQEIDGKDQLQSTSRVSRHEDTNGDGIYDKHTVFADNLSLPRMVLPLLDRVIIRETNTLDLKSYQDTNGDGVADKIELWHEGGNRGGNLEHQPSGLIWNIDNWLYTTYSNHRYRFTTGEVVRESMPLGAGQWGLTHDDVGRIFYSSAGGENPAINFQRPIIYGNISLPGEQADGFREVFPLDDIPDTQGGRARLRDDNSLNRFTASCGQSIFRGDRMPGDLYGDLIICEPVGRLIRRAKVTNDNGRIVVSNAYDQKEFIASTDPNFRPVNSATGPDGCLYLVDMYRGIIQEGNWVREGSYLRGIVQEYELDKNIGRGRIFRVEHETSKRESQQPRMLDETPAQLVAHLSHPNGWWRSEAQKLIILHSDKSVVPALQKLARSGKSALGRLHALWTLEGLDAVDTSLLQQGFADADARVRAAAVRIAESTLADDRSLDEGIRNLADDSDPNVVIQVLLSISRGAHPNAESITDAILKAHESNSPVASIANRIRSQIEALAAERRKLEELRRRNKLLAESVVRGKLTYTTLCTTCHGADGKGMPTPDNKDLLLAPPLAGSNRVRGHKERLTRILLNGLIGPVEEKTYAAGLMLPMGANDDRWIADVATYIRNSWENRAPLVEEADVARIRAASSNRVGPWTLKELKPFDPPSLESRRNWKLTASHGSDKVSASVDGEIKSRWDTGATQKPGMWFSIEMPEPTRVLSLTLDTRGSNDDYPRGYLVHISMDGKNWGDPVAQGKGSQPVEVIELNSTEPSKHIRITQTGYSPNKYWSIHELALKGLPADTDLSGKSLAQLLAEENPEVLARDAKATGNAARGAALFYTQALSCVKCHDPAVGDRLGPDLSSKRDGVTDTFLVESVLTPSKVIRKGFEPIIVQTENGLVITGFHVREDEETLVLREPASGKEIEIDKEELLGMKQGKVSAMPPGLVNLLTEREQFLDLVKFLMEVNQGGPAKQNELKSQLPK
ncbi:MAG: protein containing Coagulation factor 5/8 type [Blastopirellula sp.]|nr:MAG: protein containing Coagulation factor 5/8 type [Blastopirellula sp.]